MNLSHFVMTSKNRPAPSNNRICTFYCRLISALNLFALTGMQLNSKSGVWSEPNALTKKKRKTSYWEQSFVILPSTLSSSAHVFINYKKKPSTLKSCETQRKTGYLNGEIHQGYFFFSFAFKRNRNQFHYYDQSERETHLCIYMYI